MTDISRVAVVGAGTMGNGIVHVFAANGYDTIMIDVRQAALERALATISGNFDRQIRKGAIEESAKTGALGRIQTSTDLSACSDAQLIVEAATESRDLKFSIFREIDSLAPAGAILASNTSSISITEIAAQTERPEQVIGMHFMNPAPVMKLVELIRGLRTTDETTRVVRALAEDLGKTVAEVRDFPGFVANRVLMPMINEAIFCLMEGVADAESIDTVMKLGMNHPLGPLALADLIGLDTVLAILEVLHSGLGDDKYRPCPLLRQYVAAGKLGRKTGEGFFAYS
jgi:3-hydroxybutyryl-CoA dehydrogenase